MRLSLVLILACLVLSAFNLSAQPHGKGNGHAAEDFRGVIHSLFAEHDNFVRKVELLQDGYRAETTSESSDSAKLLQKHVTQMKERLESGLGVRHWDPAFAEFRAHYKDMVIEVKNIENGVAVSVTGRTPEAIQVAKNHAKLVSGFIDKGESEMRATHPPALEVVGGIDSERGVGQVSSSCHGCSRCKEDGKGKEGEAATGKKCDSTCGKEKKNTARRETDSE